MNRRHFLTLLASAIGALGCHFGRRERFLPARELDWWQTGGVIEITEPRDVME